MGQTAGPCPKMGQGTVNACEGYKMATSKFLPSLVYFVRGFAAWAFRVPFIADKLRTAGQGTPMPQSRARNGRVRVKTYL